jgi:hypothetical protein
MGPGNQSVEEKSSEDNLSAKAVWRVLVDECGAPDDADVFRSFEVAWPCGEYRFCGALGFGGKVRAAYRHPFGVDDQFARVDCYPEDVTPERSLMISRANERLRGQP